MAKLSLIQRELKREQLVAKFAKKYAELKAIINDAKKSDEERYLARLELQKLPRNANPTRLRNRCELTGRPRGTFRQFGLGRIKIRELAFAGDIPGVISFESIRSFSAFTFGLDALVEWLILCGVTTVAIVMP